MRSGNEPAITASTCSIKDCDRPNFARGWCAGHYQRNRIHGDPLAGGPLGVRGRARGKTCSVEGCNAPVRSRDMCAQHRRDASRQGLTTPWPTFNHPRSLAETEEFFWANVSRGDESECWPWQRPPSKNGYGQLWDGEQRASAHVFAYRVTHGEVPEGLQVDHTCHNAAFEQGTCAGGMTCAHRLCCNPAHLEAVPGRTNRLRGDTSRPFNGGR